MKEEEENQRVAEEQERNTCRLQLYCHHPKRGRIDTPFKVILNKLNLFIN
jgi:hypothetical protein